MPEILFRAFYLRSARASASAIAPAGLVRVSARASLRPGARFCDGDRYGPGARRDRTRAPHRERLRPAGGALSLRRMVSAMRLRCSPPPAPSP